MEGRRMKVGVTTHTHTHALAQGGDMARKESYMPQQAITVGSVRLTVVKKLAEGMRAVVVVVVV